MMGMKEKLVPSHQVFRLSDAVGKRLGASLLSIHPSHAATQPEGSDLDGVRDEGGTSLELPGWSSNALWEEVEYYKGHAS